MKLNAALQARKLKRGSSRVGEMKLHDELAGQGPYYHQNGASMGSDTAAGILKLNREIRAADSAERDEERKRRPIERIEQAPRQEFKRMLPTIKRKKKP